MKRTTDTTFNLQSPFEADLPFEFSDGDDSRSSKSNLSCADLLQETHEWLTAGVTFSRQLSHDLNDEHAFTAILHTSPDDGDGSMIKWLPDATTNLDSLVGDWTVVVSLQVPDPDPVRLTFDLIVAESCQEELHGQAPSLLYEWPQNLISVCGGPLLTSDLQVRGRANQSHCQKLYDVKDFRVLLLSKETDIFLGAFLEWSSEHPDHVTVSAASKPARQTTLAQAQTAVFVEHQGALWHVKTSRLTVVDCVETLELQDLATLKTETECMADQFEEFFSDSSEALLGNENDQDWRKTGPHGLGSNLDSNAQAQSESNATMDKLRSEC